MIERRLGLARRSLRAIRVQRSVCHMQALMTIVAVICMYFTRPNIMLKQVYYMVNGIIMFHK